MNYQRIYDSIIDRAKTRILICYKEKHHIIPKCLQGKNSKENLVSLTAKEHFLCHRLLTLIYPDNSKLKYALWAMSTIKSKESKRHKVSARIYQILREEFSKTFSKERKGHEVSEETREKLRQFNLGKTASFETRERMRLSSEGKVKTKEHIEKCVKSRKEHYVVSEETLEKMRKRVVSEETKLKSSKKLKGRIPWNKGKHGHLTEEQIEKYSNSQKGRKDSRETVEKRERTKRENKIRKQNGN